MSERDRLLDDLRRASRDFVATVQDAAEEAFLASREDGWSARDVAVHFAGLHRQMAGAFRRLARGESPKDPEASGLDDDAYNELILARAPVASMSETLADLQEALEECVAAAASLPESLFGPESSCHAWLAEESEHYRNHTAEARLWLAHE